MDELSLEHTRRFTRAEFDAMCDAGYFADERMELLRGYLVPRMSEGDEHHWLSTVLLNTLIRSIEQTYLVTQNGPFAATDDSVPLPDIYVFNRGRKEPGRRPSEALLLVEVAHTSYRRDKNLKLPMYAENGVPEYWIVNINTRSTEVFTDPVDGEYTTCVVVPFAEPLRPRFAPHVELVLDQLS
ncbi:MAG: Uma2 family endonuclease [Kofleriaceae bacterium]